MIRFPLIGDCVRVHYNPRVAKIAPHHGSVGVIACVGRGPGPRNVGIRIGSLPVVLPRGNLVKVKEGQTVSEHIETPWHLHPRGKANCLGDYTIFYGHGEGPHNQICQASKANAAHIVRCVNSHKAYETVAREARLALDYLDEVRRIWGDEGVLRRRADQLRAALAALPQEPTNAQT